MSDSNLYYDFHSQGLAYLNRLRLVSPNGGDSYLAVTLAFLRGKADADGRVAKTWVDCNIVGDMAKARAKILLEHIVDEGIDPDQVRIMATAKIGDLELKEFTYKKGPKAGQPGFGLKGRLLQIEHVRVNGIPFDFGDDDAVQRGDQQQTGSSAASVASDSPEPAMVKLSKDDPDFLRKKEALKRRGYRWDPEQTAWRLAQAV